MEKIWLIIANVASIVTIATLWGISSDSSVEEKVILALFAVVTSVITALWGHSNKYKVKGYSCDKNDTGKVAYLLIKNAKKLHFDTLVSVYIQYEEEIVLVAIGSLAENGDNRYAQVNIEHRINEQLLSKIMVNDKMIKRYFVKDTVRFSDISDLIK